MIENNIFFIYKKGLLFEIFAREAMFGTFMVRKNQWNDEKMAIFSPFHHFTDGATYEFQQH